VAPGTLGGERKKIISSGFHEDQAREGLERDQRRAKEEGYLLSPVVGGGGGGVLSSVVYST